MDELVRRLSDGAHEVSVGGPRPTLEDFRRRVEELRHVFVKFTGTEGGTDLGMTVDLERTSLGDADFVTGTGNVHVVGALKLNYVRVRCVADIDLATLSGTGRLEVLEEVAA